jgi:cytoskeletal protein RodZ
MADVPAAPVPGNLTVPPLFGWEALLVLLAVLVAVGVLVAVVGTARAGATGRSEWQAYLAARSSGRAESGDDTSSGRPERGERGEVPVPRGSATG